MTRRGLDEQDQKRVSRPSVRRARRDGTGESAGGGGCKMHDACLLRGAASVFRVSRQQRLLCAGWLCRCGGAGSATTTTTTTTKATNEWSESVVSGRDYPCVDLLFRLLNRVLTTKPMMTCRTPKMRCSRCSHTRKRPNIANQRRP